MKSTYQQPSADQYALEFLHALQNPPKAHFADHATDKMQPGLNKTAVDMALGTAQGMVNVPSDLISGSTKIGEQVGNAMVGEPVQWGQGIQGGKELGSSFLNAMMLERATNPLMQTDQQASAAFRKVNPSTSEGFFKNAKGQLYDPLTGKWAKTADQVKQVVQETPQTSRIIPINQGDQQIGSFDIGKTMQDYSPKVVKQLLKRGNNYVGI